MAYKRITGEERNLIYRLRKDNKSIREIARLLGRAPSSISREIRRNTGGRGYRPKQASAKAKERARRPGSRKLTEEVINDIHAGLDKGWTPAIISNRAKLEGRNTVCKETIYRYIYSDAAKGGELWKNLPRSKRKRRRRCPRQDGRGRGLIPNRRPIEARPEIIETRAVVGHWEGDLINGLHGTGNLVTLVERKSRYTLVGRTATKGSSEVCAEIINLCSKLPPNAVTGITFDNGKEFANHEQLAKELEIDVYFATPYHSWERGTNENTNGLVRRLYPKKSSFAMIGDDELDSIDRYLNDRPRKCLGWRTPREVMHEFLVSAPR